MKPNVGFGRGRPLFSTLLPACSPLLAVNDPLSDTTPISSPRVVSSIREGLDQCALIPSAPATYARPILVAGTPREGSEGPPACAFEDNANAARANATKVPRTTMLERFHTPTTPRAILDDVANCGERTPVPFPFLNPFIGPAL